MQAKLLLSVSTLTLPPLLPFPQFLSPAPPSKSLPPFPKPTPLTLSARHPSQPTTTTPAAGDGDGGIPASYVKTLAKFKSRHNLIQVLEISRRLYHPLAGFRLLLLDSPGNIHSLSSLFSPLTHTYLDVFASLPPLLPAGPLAVLGFGAGSAARLLLHFHPNALVHGWELDPSVLSVGREFFGLSLLERRNPHRLFVHEGDALAAAVPGGFSGVLVDLFSRGSLIPQMQEPRTWEILRGRLREGGRIMVNCGGSCVEAEDPSRDGDLVKEETLRVMDQVFGGRLFVLDLGRGKEDSCLALTGNAPDLAAWEQALPAPLRRYASMWSPYRR